MKTPAEGNSYQSLINRSVNEELVVCILFLVVSVLMAV